MHEQKPVDPNYASHVRSSFDRQEVIKTIGASLVEVRLITGRSHQIRAHFSEAGLPLLGDVAYGGPEVVADLAVPRQMLHSRELTFCHPVTAQKMTFTADLPDDFSSTLQHLGGALIGLDE